MIYRTHFTIALEIGSLRHPLRTTPLIYVRNSVARLSIFFTPFRLRFE